MEGIRASNDYQVYALSTRDEMLPFIPETAKSVLEVGCSVGNFGAALKARREIEVWGVEINPLAAKLAEERLDRVICAPFQPGLNLEGKQFDCLVFNDVLEHMVDPYSALIFAKDLLGPSGKVVASIPNVRYFGNIWALLMHRSWEYQDDGILDRTHLRFFTKSSIRSLFSKNGYNVESIVGINALDSYNPEIRRKFLFLNLATFGHIEDMRWLQFAVVAGLGQM